MTRAEALAEAQKRYGEEEGTVEHGYPGTPNEYFRVGRFSDPETWRPEWTGEGDSWEAAFLDADRRGGE